MSILISIIIIVLLTIFSLSCGIQIFEPPKDLSVHAGLITICSIFAGFLYTNYSILLDFSETDLAKKLRNTSILAKRNRHITQGIISSILSIISGLLLSITYNREIITKLNEYFPWGKYMLYCIEIVFVFNTIYLFIKSLCEMKQIMNAKIQPAGGMDADTINEIKEQMELNKKANR